MGKMKETNKNQDKIDKIIDWNFSDAIDKIVADVKTIIAQRDEQISFLLTHNKYLKKRNVFLEKNYRKLKDKNG